MNRATITVPPMSDEEYAEHVAFWNAIHAERAAKAERKATKTAARRAARAEQMAGRLARYAAKLAAGEVMTIGFTRNGLTFRKAR